MPDLVPAAARLVGDLLAAGCTVAVAESLTGGAVAAALVDVPGASGCLRGAVVAYATDLKTSLLGVDPALLERHGPVHPDVAAAMARGVRDRLGASYGLATTGVAGPDGQAGRRPGEFHVAVAGPAGTEVVSAYPDGLGSPLTRSAVRTAATEAVLALAVRVLAMGVARS